MDKIQALVSFDANYIIIGLLVILYTMEQLLNRPFRFDKRPQHLINNFFSSWLSWLPIIFLPLSRSFAFSG